MPGEVATLADGVVFTGTTSLALAGRLMMAKHSRSLYEHLPGVLNGDDPHNIHQMRVATRRLRASLQSTTAAYRDDIVAGLRKRLRTLARALGAVRDLDVMLIRLRSDAEQWVEDDRSELNAVIEQLKADRHRAHAALVAELRSKRTARLLRTLNDFLVCPLEDVQVNDDGLPLLVRHHAGSAIWHGFEAVQRFETVMPHASSERLHDLRIACKHLRYTLELFAPALAAEARSLIKQVEGMQEHLGLIHDVDVALAHLGLSSDQEHTGADTVEPAEAPPGPSSGYAATRLAERSRLIEAVEPMWQRLNGEHNRQKFAALLAAL